MTRVVIGTIGYVILFGTFLLVPAPRPIPWRAWALLGVLLVVRLAGDAVVYRANPALLRERQKPPVQSGQPMADRVLLVSFMAAFALLVSLASLDGLRLHILGVVPSPVAVGGMCLFISGWALVAAALRSNAFALLVIRVQEQQVVVTGGPYEYVRHPMYLGVVAVMLGTTLWLQSYLAALSTAFPALLLAGRIVLEERFITRHTAGYREYSLRVPYRLLPFIW
jgi:protein-S-isoprenylcysteine O-methyltransferase Ste14